MIIIVLAIVYLLGAFALGSFIGRCLSVGERRVVLQFEIVTGSSCAANCADSVRVSAAVLLGSAAWLCERIDCAEQLERP